MPVIISEFRSGLDSMKLNVLRFLKLAGTIPWKRLLNKGFLKWYVYSGVRMIVCVHRYDAAQFSLHYKSHITQIKMFDHALMTLKRAVFLVHSFGALMLCMLDFLCSKHMYVYDTF